MTLLIRQIYCSFQSDLLLQGITKGFDMSLDSSFIRTMHEPNSVNDREYSHDELALSHDG